MPARKIAHANNYKQLAEKTTYIVLNNFENFIDRKVFRRLESPVLPGPHHRRSLLAERFELQQRVVNAVEQYLVMDVLTLRQERAEHTAVDLRLRLLFSTFLLLFLQHLLALFLPTFLESQVEVKVQDLRVVLAEVLATSDLGVLKHVEHRHWLTRQRLRKALEELVGIRWFKLMAQDYLLSTSALTSST